MNPLLKIRNPYLPKQYQYGRLLHRGRNQAPPRECLDCRKETSQTNNTLRCRSCAQKYRGSQKSNPKREQIIAIIAKTPTMTLECIGQCVGLTRERVRQIVRDSNTQRVLAYQHTTPLEWPCPDCGELVQTTTKAMKLRASNLRRDGSDDSQLTRCKRCTHEYAINLHRKVYPPIICADCGKEILWKSKNASQMHKKRKTPYCNSCWGKRAAAIYRKPKTHCKRGHEFTPENTYIYPYKGKKTRHCRSCNRLPHNRTYPALPKIPKTHCKWGHEWNTKNTYIPKSGLRQCRECNRIHHRVKG